jgi:hypothetical protein
MTEPIQESVASMAEIAEYLACILASIVRE